MSILDLEQKGEGRGYILVDLDRTLAAYTTWNDQGQEVGEPIPAMVERVQRWLHAGEDVRIFTARASATGPDLAIQKEKIDNWCIEQFGVCLPVQNWKDFNCIAIWDDLAISVTPNLGWRRTADLESMDPLSSEEEWELVGYPPEAYSDSSRD